MAYTIKVKAQADTKELDQFLQGMEESSRATGDLKDELNAVAPAAEQAAVGLKQIEEAGGGANEELEEAGKKTGGGDGLAGKFENLAGVMKIATGAIGVVASGIGAYIARSEEAQDSLARLGDAWGQVMADFGETAGGETLVKVIDWITEALGGETAAMEEARQAVVNHDQALAASKEASAELAEQLKDEAKAHQAVADAMKAKEQAARAEIRRAVEQSDETLASDLAAIDEDETMAGSEKIRARAAAREASEQRKLDLREEQRQLDINAAEGRARGSAEEYLDLNGPIEEQEARAEAARMLAAREERMRQKEEIEKQMADELAAISGDPYTMVGDVKFKPTDEENAAMMGRLGELEERKRKIEEELRITEEAAKVARQEGVNPYMGEDDPEDTKLKHLRDEQAARGARFEKAQADYQRILEEQSKDSLNDLDITPREIDRANRKAEQDASKAESSEAMGGASKDLQAAQQQADTVSDQVVAGLEKLIDANKGKDEALVAGLENLVSTLKDGVASGEMEKVAQAMGRMSQSRAGETKALADAVYQAAQIGERAVRVAEEALAKVQQLQSSVDANR